MTHTYKVGEKYRYSENRPVGMMIASKHAVFFYTVDGWHRAEIGPWSSSEEMVVYVPEALETPLEVGQEITYDDLERLPKRSVVLCINNANDGFRVWTMTGNGNLNFMTDRDKKLENDGHWRISDLVVSKNHTLKLLHLPEKD